MPWVAVRSTLRRGMPAREWVNSISHGVGAGLSVAGLVLLVVAAQRHGGWALASALVYGISLVLLFTFSTLFHSLQGRARQVLQRFDHIGIHLLIAGTYTPYCILVLRDGWGWPILGIVWGLAFVGIVLESIFGPRYVLPTTLLYLAEGWVILLDLRGLFLSLPLAGFAWLLVGGLLYTLGAYFFLRERIPYNHEIWHFFVLGAASCHFVSVFCYVL